MDLNLLRTFVAVVETGSMTQAARRLKQPVSRVSRALARLEQDLNLRLVLRTTRSFQVTDVGNRLFRELQPAIEKLGEVQRNMHHENDELTGLVRITAPEDFGKFMLAPLITELSMLHPGLQFDINLTDDYVDLIRTETDIGIRAGKLKDSSLKAKLLGTSNFQFVAAPSYLEKYGAPKRPIDLQKHQCINALFGPASKQNQWVITNGTRTEKIDFKPKWRVNNKAMALNLACAGLGITLVPSTLLAGYYENGELVHVLSGWGLETAPVHLVYPPQKITSRKVREVSKFLEEKLKPMF